MMNEIEFCIHERTNILPKRLTTPAPTEEQLIRLVSAACAAPDHRQIQPWRLINISMESRHLLADVFETDLRRRDSNASEDECLQARSKAFRSPLLIVAICRLIDEHSEIHLFERLTSLGCAVQNILLTATSMGYGASLTTGKAIHSPELHALCKLSRHEVAVCFLSIGTIDSRPKSKVRPTHSDVLSTI